MSVLGLSKKRLLIGGLAASLTLSGLAGCSEVYQDHVISEGQQKYQLDIETMIDAGQNMRQSKSAAMTNIHKQVSELPIRVNKN